MHRKPLIVCFVGDANVGKTTLVMRLLNKSIVDIESNAGSTFVRHVVAVNDKPVELRVWDTAGVQRLRPSLDTLYPTLNILVAVGDVANSESFEELEKMITDARAAQPNLVVMFVANKMDKVEQCRVSEADIKKLSESCELSLSINALEADSSHQIQAAIQRAVQMTLEKMPQSEEFTLLSVEGGNANELPDNDVGSVVMTKYEAKKFIATLKSYQEIIASENSVTLGIRKLFHDYAHPRLFSFHLNRHHKIRADLISKSLPASIEDAREYLVHQVQELQALGVDHYDPNGSMAKRLQFALDKLTLVQVNSQNRIKL